jgi:hypothetical protein
MKKKDITPSKLKQAKIDFALTILELYQLIIKAKDDQIKHLKAGYVRRLKAAQADK